MIGQHHDDVANDREDVEEVGPLHRVDDLVEAQLHFARRRELDPIRKEDALLDDDVFEAQPEARKRSRRSR